MHTARRPSSTPRHSSPRSPTTRRSSTSWSPRCSDRVGHRIPTSRPNRQTWRCASEISPAAIARWGWSGDAARPPWPTRSLTRNARVQPAVLRAEHAHVPDPHRVARHRTCARRSVGEGRRRRSGDCLDRLRRGGTDRRRGTCGRRKTVDRLRRSLFVRPPLRDTERSSSAIVASSNRRT